MVLLAFSLNAQATLSSLDQIFARSVGDMEALYVYDDVRDGRTIDMEAILKKFKADAVSAGAETDAEVNEFLNVAIQEMTRKLNLYRSLAN